MFVYTSTYDTTRCAHDLVYSHALLRIDAHNFHTAVQHYILPNDPEEDAIISKLIFESFMGGCVRRSRTSSYTLITYRFVWCKREAMYNLSVTNICEYVLLLLLSVSWPMLSFDVLLCHVAMDSRR